MIVLENLSKTGTFFCFFGLNKQMHFSGGTTMRIHRVSVLLLCLFLLTGIFAGCKKEEDSGNTITYIPTFYPLGEEIQDVGNACSGNGMMYFIGYIPGGKESYMDAFGEMVEYDTNQQALFSIHLDGTELQQMPQYQRYEIPEDRMGNAYIENMMIGPDGALWIVENVNTYYYDLPENFDPLTQNTWEYYKEDKNFTQVRKLNADGSEAAVLNLSEIAASLDSAYDEENPRTYYIYNSVLDSEGNLYFYFYGNDGGMMVVVNSQGEVLFTLKEDNVGGEMVRLSDGRVAVMCYGEEAEMRPINVEEQDWDEGVTLPTDWYGFYTGADDFLYFYSTSSSVMGCKEDGTIEKLFTWINCDMNQDELRGISVSSLDQVVAIQTDWSGEQPVSELVVLNRTEVTPENQRKTLTMAVMWMDYDLRNEVLDYNRNNTEYRIEVQDYSEYNTQDDYQAGLTKLSTEIISGKVPDIMVVDNLPIRQYGAKGLLEDLLPYIEADEELGGREGLVQPVLNAMLQDGKLYQICSTFSINTATTSQKLAGDVTGWTVEEAKAALDKLEDGAGIMSAYTTQSNLLRNICRWNLGHYVDWESGECYFDTGDFEKLLEFSKLAPKKIDDDMYEDWQYYEDATRVREGRQLLMTETFSDWYSLLYHKSYWGEDMIYVGFPSDDRKGSAFTLNNGLAMSSKCQYKEAAWDFLRTRLDTENSWYYWGFPLGKTAFDEFMTEAMTPDTWTDENGNVIEYPKVEYTDSSGNTVKIMAMSQEDYDQFMELLNNTDKLTDYDTQILEIVMDEAQAYINGTSSAKSVAAMIQSRVKIYVNEQK